MKKILAILLTLSMCLIALVGCGEKAAPAATGAPKEEGYPEMVLTMAAQGKETGDINITSRIFMDKIVEQSEGKITFSEYWNAQLGSGPDQLTNIGSQVADIGDIVTLYTPGDLPISQIALCVPFTPTTAELNADIMNKFAADHSEITDEWEAAGCHLLFYKAIGGYNVVGNLKYNGEVKLADMKNMKIEMGGVYYPSFFSAINAAPFASASSSAAYTDLKQNVADTTFLNTIGVRDQSLFEVSNTLLKTGLGGRACHAFVINKDTWDSFDDKTKALFEKVAEETLEEYFNWAVSEEAAAEKKISEYGTAIVELADSEKSAWGNAILANANTLDKWIETVGKAGYDGASLISDYIKTAQALGYQFPFDVSAYVK